MEKQKKLKNKESLYIGCSKKYVNALLSTKKQSAAKIRDKLSTCDISRQGSFPTWAPVNPYTEFALILRASCRPSNTCFLKGSVSSFRSSLALVTTRNIGMFKLIFTIFIDLLKQLHWLPIQWRIRFKLASLTYKALHIGHPPYLAELLQYHKPTRSTRLSASHSLSVPCHNLSFGWFLYLNSQNMERLTASHSAVSNALFI